MEEKEVQKQTDPRLILKNTSREVKAKGEGREKPLERK